MQVPMKGWAAAVSVAFLAACTQVPSFNSGSAPASSAGATPPLTALGGMPITVNCGEGKQALVKQVSFDGKTQSQVDCVDMPRILASRDVQLLEDDLEVAPAPAPVRRAVYRRPPARERVVVREVPREVPRDDDYDYEPPVSRTSTSRRNDDVYDDTPSRTSRTSTSRRKRPGEQSAAIIVGSTAAGAGAGAIIGGKKGAIIGAVIGGVGGTIYDRKTRNPK